MKTIYVAVVYFFYIHCVITLCAAKWIGGKIYFTLIRINALSHLGSHHCDVASVHSEGVVEFVFVREVRSFGIKN